MMLLMIALVKNKSKKIISTYSEAEYLREIIKRKASKNWDTDERDYNILCAETDSAKTFGEAAESMYFMLDLFEYGYTIDTEENYKDEHPEVYPNARKNNW